MVHNPQVFVCKQPPCDIHNQNGGRLINRCGLYVDKIIFLAQKGPCGLNSSAALCPANTVLNISIFQFHSSTTSIANGQTVLKIGKTVLTSLPLHHQSTSIKHRRIHHHFHRFLSNLQYFPRLKRRRVVLEWNHQTPILVQSSHQHTTNHCHE